MLRYLCGRPKADSYMEVDSVHEFATRTSRSEQGLHLQKRLLHCDKFKKEDYLKESKGCTRRQANAPILHRF